ncbi:hypothetical protein CI109_102326 [Kwoniella shandongensis]|uniref:Uncharacterized protein n=1 Tax=Kwoniella shandongensis TaxID=1734106 RepID=A0A5M6C0A0_9TREE|nr:uncharacterized protein CI109_003354 [Kwoniella shandongensis]KAA5528453.1 hypothetical protein CI109_003354 [Kwoniella shandongensis]
MSYPQPSLPPISTLSAALANGSNSGLPIAPELLGDEGLPPDINRRPSEPEDGDDGGTQQSSSFGGYQSSSAREEGSRGWSGYGNVNPPTRHHHPWEEGYRDHTQSQQQTSLSHPPPHSYEDGVTGNNISEEEEPPKPRKRARVSKPRPSKDKQNGSGNGGGGSTDNGLPTEGILDFADPSGDLKLGPVFVHPPKGAAQACVRCHKIKRKCDNARPRCAGCSKADVACVFEISPATAGYVSNLKSDNLALTSQIASAAERIQHLEAAVSNLERGLPPPPEPSSSHFDSLNGGSQSPRADFPAIARSILAVRPDQSANPVFGPTSIHSLDPNLRPSSSSSDRISLGGFATKQARSPLPPYPPYQLALQAVETFFVCNAISYPFIDRDKFMRDMDDLYRRDSENGVRSASSWSSTPGGDEEIAVIAGKEFILFMVIAIGTTNRERMGEVEKGSSRVFKKRAMMGLSAAVAREDILCVQSLILLGIYAMFDPSGVSLWHVVGFAARVATALNLHRRVDDTNVPAKVVEHRKRVFYSLFNLDRLVAVTLSKPLAIVDNDIDVELPSPLPSDSPFRGRARIDFTRHIIKLRRLSGIILTTVYSVSGEQNALPEPERAGIIMDLHSRLDTWLAECPMPPDTEEEKRGMITNHSWFLLNYHQGLCLLYRPSPLYPVMTPERLSALHEASTRCVDLYIDLWHDHKVSYNLINVSMQFLACISLLYCLCEYDSRDAGLVNDPNWRREVSQRVGQCHDLLEAFSRALPETAKYREIFSQLSEILLGRHGPLRTPGDGQDGTATAKIEPSIAATRSTLPITSTSTSATRSIMIPPPSSLPIGNATNEAAALLASNGHGNGQAGPSENESAWNAMTQLWYNSGDFNFDQRALNSITSEDGQVQGQGMGRSEKRDLPVATALVGEDGLSQGLWNQLG